MRDNYYLFGLGAPARSYVVNGVTYQVGSRYAPIDFKTKKQKKKTVFDRVCHYLNNDFADLTDTGIDSARGDSCGTGIITTLSDGMKNTKRS